MTALGNWCINSVPDAPDITVNNTTIEIASATGLFVHDALTISDSTGGLGLEFTLSDSPLSVAQLLVAKNGVLGRNTIDFTLADDVLTLTEAIASGDKLDVYFMAVQ